MLRLRKEVKKLRVEKEISKKRLLCEGNEVRFKATTQWALNYSIVDLCSALRVSPGAYYHWRRKPANIISEGELLLYREAKRLFSQTRSGIAYVKLCRALNKPGFAIGETRARTIMRKLNLKCTQRQSYKPTTNSNRIIT
ncbi:MAG: hypothetical protein JKX81_16805 [Arenicella sp.]|nr:hypothetical protein [Arenicella sp.]